MPSPIRAKKARPGNTRVTGKEQFYTPENLAAQLVDELAKQVPNLAEYAFIEPAGGTGSFIEAVKSLGATKMSSFDIEPKHPDVKKGDFLKQRLSGSGAITISNPPFGRNNALSIPFFNHAAPHSEYIAFIVPRSWRKWSVINRLDRDFHLIADHDVNVDYVDDANALLSTKMRLNTCFQIWQRRPNRRPLIKVQDRGVVAKVSPAEADVALTVFGYGCGTLQTEFERKPNTTKMFLKLQHPSALTALQSVDYSRFYRNTAYTEALSFQEINYLLNEAIFGDASLIDKG